jgi:sulfur-oxidizing protein SoxY
MKRRILLKGTAASVSLVAAAAAGLLVPVRLLAADWPQTAFESDDAGNAIKDYFGDAAVVDSDQVVIKAPLQAENGAVVPIKVSTTLANVESIAIIVEKNPIPFVASLDVLSGTSGALFSSEDGTDLTGDLPGEGGRQGPPSFTGGESNRWWLWRLNPRRPVRREQWQPR